MNWWHQKWKRRAFLGSLPFAALGLAVAEAKYVEPEWLKVTHLKLNKGPNPFKVVHLTDIHYKGNRAYLEKVVEKINTLEADYVLFTGDLIEEASYLEEAVDILESIKPPIIAVAGNHDHWSGATMPQFRKKFASIGAAWLEDQAVTLKGGKLTIYGDSCLRRPSLQPTGEGTEILLMHYPGRVDFLKGMKYSLMLAGHSHGGQVRIPLYGPIVLPAGVGKYDLGLFETESGPLYVSAGIGWFYMNFRFNCRPEIALIEI